MKRLVVDSSICTGCRACETACSSEHFEKFSPELSRVRVVKIEEKGVDVPVTCKQCKNAPCIKACPVDALYKDPDTNATLVDHDKCISCGQCIEACPFAAISMDNNDNIMICDLCSGSPRCVEVCPVDAIKYEELGKVSQKKRIEYAEKEAEKVRRRWGL